jgi:DNA-binding transcriptional regulator YdaS (Cro superfamily)
MATRKSNLRPSDKDLISIAGDLGAQARVFNDNEVRHLLRAAVELAGTQVAFAKRHGLDRTHLNQVLKGKSRVSGSLLKCLGLRKAYTLDQAANPGGTSDAHALAPALEHVET